MDTEGFKPRADKASYETRDAYAEFGKVGVHVTGGKDCSVKVFACMPGGMTCSLTMTADQARMLAAELIASADSTVQAAA